MKLPTARKFKIILVTTTIFAAIGAFLLINLQRQADAAFGLQVSPVVLDLRLSPGETKQDVVKIQNISTERTTYYPQVLDFVAKGETGAPTFVEKLEDINKKYSLSTWVNISIEPVTLRPNQKEALNYTISVPADAEPGSHFGGILFATAAPSVQGTQVGIAGKIGMLLLVRVSGDANETARVEEFSSDKSFYEYPPVKFTTRIENQGNVHLNPLGVIEIKNTFGSKVASVDVNSDKGAVLPESIRRFEETWDKKGFTLGRYTATLNLTYGDSGKTLTSAVSFWIVPWKPLLVGFLALIIIILLIVVLLRLYNRWIISKAQKAQKPPTQTPPSPPVQTPPNVPGNPK